MLPLTTTLKPGRVLVAAINITIIVCLTLFVYFIVSKQYQETILYDQAKLVFSSQDEAEQQQFAVMEDKGKFLFAAGAPGHIGPALFFHATGDIRVWVESQYNSKLCSPAGVGKASISFSTPVERLSLALDGKANELILPILAGDRVRVRISNSADPDCGRAMLRLRQDTHLVPYILAFLFIWLGILAIFSSYHIGALSIWGAGIHASYIVSEYLYGQTIETSFTMAALLSLFAVGLVLLPLYNRPLKPVAFIFFLVSVLFALGLPLLNIGNYLLFGSPMDTNTVHAILQTNYAELTQYVDEKLSAITLSAFGLCMLIATIVAIYVLRSANTALKMSAMGLVFISLFASFYTRIENEVVTLKIWRNGVYSYSREFSAFRKLVELRAKSVQALELSKTGDPRVTVLVIGESHNKNHMSLYGYPRPTTPILQKRLDEGSLIVMENAYSNHTHTSQSLSLALTQANQYNFISWVQSPSIVEVANQANIETYWLSNQQMLGIWDNKIALVAKESDQVIALNKKVGIHKNAENYDEKLLDSFQSIAQEPGEKFIVLHLMGNHAGYCDRYPERWKLFSDELETRYFGKLDAKADNSVINCYDNSVAYNDFFLGQIFTILEQSTLPASVFYFADHSEDVFGDKGHNQLTFEYSMTEAPIFFWATNQWQQQNKTRWAQLKHNRNKIFTNDLVFDTLLGLMGLQGKSLDSDKDLSSTHYTRPEKPLTLHGRVHIDSPNNKSYWQKQNAAFVSANGLSTRLLPHRVNTLGKMHDVTHSGMNSFEVDVRFIKAATESYFEVGHDSATMSGMRLQEMLADLPHGFGKIWLDIKNARRDNIYELADRLDELDTQFSIRRRFIIETGNASKAPKVLADRGYHLSYYLPTAKALATLKGNENERLDLANELSDIVQQQQAHAVSFDLRLYHFVKHYLEPRISPAIDYHTWSPGVNFAHITMIEALKERPYFNDQRVKTILLPYSSAFSL